MVEETAKGWRILLVKQFTEFVCSTKCLKVQIATSQKLKKIFDLLSLYHLSLADSLLADKHDSGSNSSGWIGG